MITTRDALIDGIEELAYQLTLAYDFQNTGYDPNHPDALNVVGNKIMRGGQPIALRGVSFAGYNSSWNDVMQRFTEFQADTALASTCNIIRLPVQNNVMVGAGFDLKAFVDGTMANIVNHITGLGYYVILDYHMIVDWDRALIKENIFKFWELVAPKFKDNPRVLYELFNEPMNSAFNTAKNHASFVKYFQPLVNMVRAYAPENIIIMGNPDWTTNLLWADDFPFVGKNIVHAFHVYPNIASNVAEGLSAWLQSEIHESLPVIVTEFGWSTPDIGKHTDLTINPQFKVELEDFFRERPWIGWTAWNWDTVSLPAMQQPHGVDLRNWVVANGPATVNFTPPAPLPDIAALSEVAGAVVSWNATAPNALTVTATEKIEAMASAPVGSSVVQATDNNRPLRVISGPRYLARFDGNDRLTVNGNAASRDKLSIVVIARANTLDATDRRLFDLRGATGSGAVQIYRKGNTGTMGASVSSRAATSTQWPMMPVATANNDWVAVILTLDGSNGRVGLRCSDQPNIVSVTTTAAQPFFTTGLTLSIGDMVNGGAGWRGDVAEVAIIDGVLSQKWVNKINEYVAKTYG